MNQNHSDQPAYGSSERMDVFSPQQAPQQVGYSQSFQNTNHQHIVDEATEVPQGFEQQPKKDNWFRKNIRIIAPVFILLIAFSVVVLVGIFKDDDNSNEIATEEPKRESDADTDVDLDKETTAVGSATTLGKLPLIDTSATEGKEDSEEGEGEEVAVTGSEPKNYAQSLALIKASNFRNTEEDSSPFLKTPSAALYNESSLYGTAADHLSGRGEYNTDEYISGGYFPGNGAGTFRSSCEVSHFSYDDPVVFPGKPEAAHLHMFIGNTDTNAFTTYDTLMNSGGSTCNGGELNRTAYWVPAMFNGTGEVVVPSEVRFYYKTEQKPGIGKVVQYPENMQLLGDKTNNVQDNLDLATFRCNSVYNGAKGQPSATIPNCPAVTGNGQPGVVEQLIYFDYCWNGNESTVGDWKANRDTNLVPPERYWHSSVCPASHPKLLPALVTHIFYDIKPGEDSSKWFISSDVNPKTSKLEAEGGTTAHADWFGAWNKQINKEWNDNCNNVLNAECGSGLLADPKGNTSSGVRALRLRNDFISGYNSPKARIPVKDIYEQMCSKAEDNPFSAAQGGAAAAYCQPEKHSETSHK